ncbi:ATP-dependent helicase [Paenibacillus sp. CGMCC 1.16610]|uniref:UvrD-helicase domain-containing protein n=1 Tax=Paenibacillus TaxID=44249 RepID=UPI0012F949D2|nr:MULTISPECIES: ATP-dependent helicase [Paenibacillus]MBA2941051.1 ATP-dependent helicase [Paenibacillus sp. CGMCC 1.16610]
MVAGLEIKNSFTLVNAPAGSGKTTAISKLVKVLLRSSEKKILCITFTNRATEQLRLKIDDEQVEISTIHSFISNFMLPFFNKVGIKEYYGEVFALNIEQILSGSDPTNLEKIEKFKLRNNISPDKLLDREFVIGNMQKIYYSETQYSSYLYGGLSHDDLLLFSRDVLSKFTKINNLISQKYSYVFIDEYQDTNTEILELFHKATQSTKTKLVLLGDEMQQIYADRGEGFEPVLEEFFEKDRSLKKNWRSNEHIVTILNNLYFDPSYSQDPQIMGGQKPQLHLVDSVDKVETEEDVMQLVLYNSDLFDRIGAGNLYRAFLQKYSFNDKHTSKQVLLDLTDNPDELMKLFIFIMETTYYYSNKKYGEVLKRIVGFNYLNEQKWRVNKHSDKLRINMYLQEINSKFNEDITILELIDFLQRTKLFDANYLEQIINNLNENVNFKERIATVKLIEFKRCYNESKIQTTSTQHAVKGEGHPSIALKITDGAHSPNVQMYLFLELIAKDMFNYTELKEIVPDIRALKENYTKLVGFKISSSITKDSYEANKVNLNNYIIELDSRIMRHNHLYSIIFQTVFVAYFSSSNVSNFKKCLSAINKIEGIILAYKLFYVGCSRAMNKLDVYVSLDKVNNFKTEFVSKMQSIGFDVVV